MYHGDINLGDTIDFKFSTVNASGVPTTLAGSPVLSAYVGNGTTEITAGITLLIDFDGRTGLHNVRVVATSGNGFATATNIDIVITTGTVNSVSVVGIVVGSFSIEARSSLRPTVAGRTLDVSATGEAGVDWANVGSPTTANNLSGTNIKTDQVVASVTGAVGSVTGAVGSVTGAVGSVTGNVGGNVVGSVASVSGNVGGNVVGSVASVVGAVGSVTGLTASNLDATVSSRATPAQILTTALTEAYAADGAAGTLSQILYGIQAFLQERSVSGVTQTVKKLDGAATAMTFTLDSAVTPTSITRAT